MNDYSVNLTGKDNLSGTIKNVKNAIQDLGSTAATNLDKFKQRFEKIEGSAAPLKRQLRDLKALMTEMNFKGLSNTQEFTQIAQYAGQIKDAMDDAGTATKRFSSDTQALEAAAGAFNVVTGAATALTGAMNLFGQKNDEVAQAILRVQSAIAILNGVQSVANALNKDSALMQAIKGLRMKIATEYTRLNTVATKANTTAEVANTVETEVGTAAKVKETTAEVANTVATGANTVAQKAWNMAKAISKALLGDFTGLLIVGAAGLAAYAMSTDDSTEGLKDFNEALDGNKQQLGEQLSAYAKLSEAYNKSDGDLNKLKKSIIDNKEEQKKLGIAVNTTDKVHALFSKNSTGYINAALARIQSMAAEAMMANTLGEVITGLTKAYAALARGEEVNWSDFTNIIKKLGLADSEIKNLLKGTGLHEDFELLGKNNVGVDNRTDLTASLNDLIFRIMRDVDKMPVVNMAKSLMDEANKTLQQEAEGFDGKTWSQLFDEGVKNSTESTKKAGKTASDTAKEVDNSVKKVLTTLEGCDAIIEEANAKIKKLDRSSEKYASTMAYLRGIILQANIKKFDLIDQSTISGLGEARQQVQNIINLLPEGSETLKEWQTIMLDLNKKLSERALNMIDTSSIKGMGEAKNTLRDIINMMDIHDPQVAALARHWYEVNKEEREAKNMLDNMMNGVDPNSINSLRQTLQDLEKEKFNIDPTIEGNLQRLNNIDYLIETLKEEIGNRLAAMGVTITAPLRYDVTFEYKKSNLEKLQDRLDFIKDNIERLEDVKVENVGEKMFDKAQEDLTKFRELLYQVKREATMTEISDDMKEYSKTLKEDAYEGAKTFTSGLSGMYDAIEGLPDKLDEAKNGMEAFAAITDTIFTVVDSVKAFVDAVNAIIGVLDLLKGAKAAHAAMTEKETATMVSEVFALNASSAAESTKSATDAAAVAPATALAAANKALAAETEQMAAAQMFAAHASIPFVGAALGAANVAIMEGTLRSLSALSKFAGGGIVGGNSYSGDKLIARVNSGEMILNSRQQRNLFNAINSGDIGGNSTPSITWRIKGADLYGTLKNYQKIKGKSGIITGIQ